MKNEASFNVRNNTIVSQGDVNGAVMMLSANGDEYATPEQLALVQAAAMYFGKQMEE